MTLIVPKEIRFQAHISEIDLRERLAKEMLESVGGLDAEGNLLPGVDTKVLRGSGRQGGYTITVTGPAPTEQIAQRLLSRDES